MCRLQRPGHDTMDVGARTITTIKLYEERKTIQACYIGEWEPGPESLVSSHTHYVWMLHECVCPVPACSREMSLMRTFNSNKIHKYEISLPARLRADSVCM